MPTDDRKTTEPLKVLHISPEAAPFSKVGGLADVAGSLPSALRDQSLDCRLLTPAWDGALDEARDRGFSLTKLSRKAEAVIGWKIFKATVWKCMAVGMPVYFLETPSLFSGRVYPQELTPDSVVPFLFLSLAALDLPEATRWTPRILHCHDWGTGPVSAALQWHRHFRNLRGKYKTVFTIHNLAHQGCLPLGSLREWGLDDEAFTVDALEFYGMANLLKGALIASDAVTTVSPGYALEIQTDDGGERLGGLLRSISHKVSGILNGLDVHYWNPAEDSLLPERYSAKDLSGKTKCKAALLEKIGWLDDGRPLFTSVGRMVEQKGFAILLPALEALVEKGCRLFFIGSGQLEYEETIAAAAARWPDAVAVFRGYDEPLAHLAYAGGDFFLMPSRFEPCGLSQLISLRYGTIPVVHATGGLVDTVFKYNAPGGNGFLFREYTSQALIDAVMQALTLYPDEKSRLKLITTGMDADYSWNHSAPLYAELYTSLLP